MRVLFRDELFQNLEILKLSSHGGASWDKVAKKLSSERIYWRSIINTNEAKMLWISDLII